MNRIVIVGIGAKPKVLTSSEEYKQQKNQENFNFLFQRFNQFMISIKNYSLNINTVTDIHISNFRTRYNL